MVDVKCPKCGNYRKLKYPTDKICRKCVSEARKTRKKTYDHKCKRCGIEWTTKTDTKATYCRKCAMDFTHAGVKNKWDKIGRVAYYFFCAKCSDVRISNTLDRSTVLCSTCSRKHLRKIRETRIYFDFDTMTIKDSTMRYYKFCLECGDMKEVPKHRACAYVCKQCRVPTPKAKKRKRNNAASVKGVDGKQKISESVLNRIKGNTVEDAVIEDEVQYTDAKIVVRPYTRSEEDMIQEYLRGKDV